MTAHRRTLAAALGALTLGLLACWPMRLLVDGDALARRGLGAADLQGPAWRARALGAHWRGRELGDAQLRLDAWALLLGQQRLRIRTAESALTVVRGRRQGVVDATGSWPLRLPGAGATRIDASLRFAGFDALFSGGRCVHAGGVVGIRLELPAAGAAAPLELQGTPRCQGDAVAVRLAGAGPEADLRIQGDGRWRLDTRLPATDPAHPVLAAGPGLAGFQPADGHYRRVDLGFLFDRGGPPPAARE